MLLLAGASGLRKVSIQDVVTQFEQRKKPTGQTRLELTSAKRSESGLYGRRRGPRFEMNGSVIRQGLAVLAIGQIAQCRSSYRRAQCVDAAVTKDELHHPGVPASELSVVGVQVSQR